VTPLRDQEGAGATSKRKEGAGATSKRYVEDNLSEQLVSDLAVAAGGAHRDKIHVLQVQEGQFRYMSVPVYLCLCQFRYTP